MTNLILETLAQRVESLEKKITEPTAVPNNWASVVGMFDADPELMQQVLADAAAIREAECRAVGEESTALRLVQI